RPVAQAEGLEPLEEAAVEEDPSGVALEEMLGAGDGAAGAPQERERRAHSETDSDRGRSRAPRAGYGPALGGKSNVSCSALSTPWVTRRGRSRRASSAATWAASTRVSGCRGVNSVQQSASGSIEIS